MHFTQKRLEQLSQQYGMDGGGYCFENTDIQELKGCVVWDDPDFDYLTGEAPTDTQGKSCFFTFSPNDDSREWPKSIDVLVFEDETWHYSLVATGFFFEMDTECHCRGKMVDGGFGLEWEATGNVMDDPQPDCQRCEGDGLLTREGGAWAVYTLEEKED